MATRKINPWFLLGVTLLVLALGFGGSFYLSKNGPKSVQQAPEVILPSVEVITVSPGDHPITLIGQGNVIPTRQTEIKAEVAGKITDIANSFVVGGKFLEGEVMIRIAREDYETAVTAAETNVAQAELALQQEEKRAAQAVRDWKKLGQGKQADPLVLREPQRAVAEATVASSRSSLEQARRNLERTNVLAPYNCLVLEKGTELGGMVAAGSLIAVVEQEGEREVRVPLSLEDFSYLKREGGELAEASVVLKGQLGTRAVTWDGTVIREEGRIDSQSRTAHVIVEVHPNETGLPLPPSGLFLQAELQGITLTDVVEIPRITLLDRSQVLILTEDSELELREVAVVRREAEVVYVSEGLAQGEQVVTSAIDAPVNGMKVVVAEEVSP